MEKFVIFVWCSQDKFYHKLCSQRPSVKSWNHSEVSVKKKGNRRRSHCRITCVIWGWLRNVKITLREKVLSAWYILPPDNTRLKLCSWQYKSLYSLWPLLLVCWCSYDISLNHIIILGNCPLGQVGVLPIMACRRRLCSIPYTYYRCASYPIARCSCQNVFGGHNRQHTL